MSKELGLVCPIFPLTAGVPGVHAFVIAEKEDSSRFYFHYSPPVAAKRIGETTAIIGQSIRCLSKRLQV